MKQEGPAQIERYLRILFRRCGLVMAPLVVGVIGAAAAVVVLPKVYEARSLVRVQYPQVSSISFREIQGIIAERLKTIQEEIKSFGQLLAVVHDLGLDAPLEPLSEVEREIATEDIVRQLQNNLTIKTRGAREAIDIIEIALEGRDPVRVRDIVNALTQQYINRNMAQKLDRLRTTVAFLEAKVDEYEGKLSASSEALREFRQTHLEDLTGVDTRSPREESYLADINALKAELRSVELRIDMQEAAKTELQEKLSTERVEVGRTRLSSLEFGARDLEQEIEALLQRWTEEHPEVKRVRGELTRVRRLLEQRAAEETERVLSEGELVEASPIYAELRRQLIDVDKDLIGLKSSRAVLEKQIEVERDRVRRVPELLAQIKRLTEEDGSNRSVLERYSRELAQAKFQLDVEKELKGISFEILETARTPRFPVKPKRLMILFMSLLIGGGLGVGLALYVEASDTSFRTVDETGQFLEVPVVGTIPAILTRREQRRQRWRAALRRALLALCVMVIVAAAAAVLYGLGGG